MRTLCISLLLAAGTLLHCRASPLTEEGSALLQQYVQRLTNHMEERVDGHCVTAVHAGSVHTHSLRRLSRRDAEHSGWDTGRVVLDLGPGHRLDLHVTRRSVLSADSRLVERVQGGRLVQHHVPHDCFLQGHALHAPGTASLSLCRGEMMGLVQTSARHYTILPLPRDLAAASPHLNHALHVLVFWTDGEKTENQTDASVLQGEDHLELTEDEVETEDETDGARRAAVSQPSARPVSSHRVVVEVGVYMDTFYQHTMESAFGPQDTRWFLTLVALKMSGVWAVLSDPKLGWEISIRLVHVEIWKQNPSWYTNQTKDTIGHRLHSICHGTQNLMFDQVSLFTDGVRDGKVGLGYVHGVCNKASKCSAVYPNMKITREVHELGHNLGLGHESSMQEKQGLCVDEERAGFMGGGGPYARSCYKDVFDTSFPKESCLFSEHFSSVALNISLLTPGMEMGLDGYCQFLFGQDYSYLPSSESVCSRVNCVAGARGGGGYSRVRGAEAAFGNPCAPGQVCGAGAVCRNVDSTSLSHVYQTHRFLDGGWGAWTPLSSCPLHPPSDKAAIRYATRACDNPRPHMGAFCQGPALKVQLCAPSVLQASDGIMTVAEAAGHICTQQRSGTPSDQSSMFTGTGKVASAGEVLSCAVTCHLSNGKFSREDFMAPDGVKCVNDYVRFKDDVTGISRFCVQGRCMGFHCNGVARGEAGGQVRDKCGVCGGSSDTCVHGQYTGPLQQGERHTLVIIPAGASDIYIGHDFHVQRDVFIELYSHDGGPGRVLLSHEKGVHWRYSSLQHPLSLAGTHWLLDKTLQTLTAVGPTTQPLNVTLYKGPSKHVSFQSAVYRYTTASGQGHTISSGLHHHDNMVG